MHIFSGYFSRRARTLSASLPILFIALIMILAACGGGTPAVTTSKYGGKIKAGLGSDVVTLDPVKSSAFVDREVMLNLYDTLVRVDQQNNIVADLATTWTYQSPTQLVFTLRTDVKFQDGTPFNADAVVFNINRILSTPSSPRFSEMSSVENVQAVDASHVQFNLKKPFSPLLATLSDRSGMIYLPPRYKRRGRTWIAIQLTLVVGLSSLSSGSRETISRSSATPITGSKTARGTSFRIWTALPSAPSLTAA